MSLASGGIVVQKVYVMEDPYRKLVKIGISKNPKRRLSGVRSEVGEPMIQLVEVFDVNPLTATIVERHVHSRLYTKRVFGEWFRCTPGEAIQNIQIVCGGKDSCDPSIEIAYYEGLPCTKCKDVLKYVSNRGCVTCTRVRSSSWRRNNRVAHNEQQISYRRRKNYKQETPRWANLQTIDEIYTECNRLTQVMRIDMVVIHEIPINGKDVCGLHVENNLKIVSRSWRELRDRDSNAGPRRFI